MEKELIESKFKGFLIQNLEGSSKSQSCRLLIPQSTALFSYSLLHSPHTYIYGANTEIMTDDSLVSQATGNCDRLQWKRG